MEIARQENITPPEALLSLVRTSMGKVAYAENVLVARMHRHVEEGGDPLDPPKELDRWLRESRQERLLAAKTAQGAISAGVMMALAHRTDLEGSLVADAVTAALDVLGLGVDERMKALGAAQERLLSAE